MVPTTEQARGSGRAPAYKRWAPWVGGVILAAGVAFAIVAFFPKSHSAPTTAAPPQSNTPAVTPVKPKKVALSKEATAVARQFLQTAVDRSDLDTAWKISGPDLRGGLTHAQWMTGNIPVVPYPMKALAVARFKIDYSYADQAQIEVALLPKKGATIKPQTFYLGLKKVSGTDGKRHWVVDNWVPRSTTLVPIPGN
jgi:hypothetical protein